MLYENSKKKELLTVVFHFLFSSRSHPELPHLLLLISCSEVGSWKGESIGSVVRELG